MVYPQNSSTTAAIVIVFCSLAITACLSKSSGSGSTGSCPQVRDTEYAPARIASLNNPLVENTENIIAGQQLYSGDVKPVSCETCHGEYGTGNGPLASQFSPAPRNFTCTETMRVITDGQLYWIIKNGSVGTSMPAYTHLEDTQIWQLVMYIRQFASTNKSNNS